MCWQCDMREAWAARSRRPQDPRPFPLVDDAEYHRLVADYAERHGLDDDAAVMAIYRHGLPGTQEHH